MKKKIFAYAVRQATPIMCSYLFVSMAYGMMMQEAGFGWGWSLFTSLTVYTGAFQFVLVTFLSSGASVLTVVLTALFMNSRQIFYGLSFVKEFPKMGKRYPYMVHTMTDEAYAVYCAMLQKAGEPGNEIIKQEKDRRDAYFYVAILSRISWMVGAVAGGVIGQLIPFQLEGIDFCMTALFVIIFLDQWKAYRTHLPVAIAAGCGIVCLLIFGQSGFMLPALILVCGLLLVFEKQISAAIVQQDREVNRND